MRFIQLGRREFITLLGGTAAMWPLAANAQQTDRTRRIGVLLGGTESDPQVVAGLAAFKAALQELGWADGRNIRIDYRFGAADVQRTQKFAKELVGLRPDVLVGHATPAVGALKHETTTIPIVFVSVSDPVGSGFAESLPHPGGNITGFVNLEASLGGKWIEVLKDILPGVSRAVLMFNPETAPYSAYYLQPFETAARAQGIVPDAARVRDEADIERVVADVAGSATTGLVIMPDAFTSARPNVDLIVALAARYRVLVIYPYRYMVAAGGLVSYGTVSADLFRRAPVYIDRILKGASPSDLPIQLPTQFELAINLKTARALGIEMPPTMLGRADEVIE
jgi:putative ABC transport system substrate-binding protein